MREQINKMIAGRIKALRKEKKVSREHLEEACNLPNQSIKRIEMERMSKIDVNDLCAVAEYFNVDIDYLLGRQETPLRSVSDASEVTGLSYDAVKILSSFGKMNQTEIDTLSAVICSPSFLLFTEQMKRYCLLEGESRNLLIDGYPSLTDKEVMIAAIQNSVSLLMNEVKTAAQGELIETDRRTRAFALVASAAMKVNRTVTEADILESLSECGLDADKEIQAFHKYFIEYEQNMKERV